MNIKNLSQAINVVSEWKAAIDRTSENHVRSKLPHAHVNLVMAEDAILRGQHEYIILGFVNDAAGYNEYFVDFLRAID